MTRPTDWKLLFQSVQGTSHRADERPCQDYCRVRMKPGSPEPLLVLACADGAGSAAHAQIGARLACETSSRLACATLGDGSAVATITRETAVAWYGETRERLAGRAAQLQVPVRELACTLLLAAVGESSAAFCQVGDGAIVCLKEDHYQAVFWPQNGEYANTTNFVTDPHFADHLAFACWPMRIDEVAMLTDGVQRLALNYATNAAHGPFFAPMFQPLRRAERPGRLQGALRKYLDSPEVNQRTDDDKTVILATRVPPFDESTHPL